MVRSGSSRSASPCAKTPVFDLASLTKPLATALAVMALVDDGALALGTRVGKLLPELDGTAAGAPTVEQLLLHTGGYPVGAAPVDLERGLGHGLAVLAARARAASASFAAPGTAFEYSDLGYLVLGAVVERVAREPLEAFVSSRLYARLGLRDTGFRRFRSVDALDCPSPTARDLARLVPTERRGPAFLRGEVHDPLAYALGGVAGNAGLFATADEVAALAQAVLDGGALRGAAPESARILSERQAREMTRPRAVPGGKRALGWDVDTKYSGARGGVFPVGGFGHTGFTGTSVWADRASDTVVVVLASRLHPAGKGDAGPLRRRVATLVGRALRPEAAPRGSATAPSAAPAGSASVGAAPEPGPPRRVRTGLDVLEREGFERLRGRRVGLLTHLPATDGAGRTTLELFAHAPEVELVRLFAPEHGLDARGDGAVPSGREPTTGLPLVGLYGAHDRPSAAELAGLDVLVVDLVDVGARFYTYLATLTYALEAAASAGLPVLVLDRPNPGGGLAPEGPLTQAGRLAFVAPHELPVRHALTQGELARLLCAERKLACRLEVVA
ncbi:MAG: DUF1343 domain-containing protein, partial [Polyangiaceae bacterium]|nr:DUF1343 domain-containing protein [Polyangiaceae bacterium]